jgi:hypothetical protein
MSEDLLSLYSLKPILDVLFGLGALAMFGEFIIVLRRAVSLRFTVSRVIELSVCIFLFVLCLDWMSAFMFFRNAFAPIVWGLLTGKDSSPSGSVLGYLVLSILNYSRMA